MTTDLPGAPTTRHLAGVALVSATLLMTELALTRIFSVVMYYHFAFLAISIALFGISASGVTVYVARGWLAGRATDTLLAAQGLIFSACEIVALVFLVRLRVGLHYSPRNLVLMLAIYALAALPFFSGGLIITLAVSRFTARINAVYAADLMGAAAGCLMLIPLLDRLGAPGVVLTAAALASVAAVLFAPLAWRRHVEVAGAIVIAVPLGGQLAGARVFDVVDTKGHVGDRILFSKWNSFSRIGVYEREHGDWSLSKRYHGPLPETRFMDIDSAASTPILHLSDDLSDAQYLRYDLTALAYQLMESRAQRTGRAFDALVIGPGGGRDLASALIFGARHVDGVEINPIIADDVMRERFRAFSGDVYTNPKVRIAVDDGRSFVRRAPDRYDVIQASLVDTWAATAAGAYTLTENTLYTVEAFNDYLDHLTPDGMLSITRWVVDGLRLVSLAQAACASRGWSAPDRLIIVRQEGVANFLLKKTPFTPEEIADIREVAGRLAFEVLYAPDRVPGGQGEKIEDTDTADYARLVASTDPNRFYDSYYYDIRPTFDDRPFFFHTTKLKNQFDVAFGRAMLFGNGLSALLTLLAISLVVVTAFVIGPLYIADRADRGARRPPGALAWLVYFGALGAGYMLIEVAVLQRFVLLLGHPVYSLTVTLFSLLLGSGIGAAVSRRFPMTSLRRATAAALVVVAAIALGVSALVAMLIGWAIPFARVTRIAIAVGTLVPIGVAMGIPMPAGLRLLHMRAPDMLAWAWGINGALSVVGATVAIFVAMNWGFRVTLDVAAGAYLVGLAAMTIAR